MSQEYNPLPTIISIWICNSRYCHALYICVYHKSILYFINFIFISSSLRILWKEKKCMFLYSYPCIYISGIFFYIYKINYKDMQHREYSQYFITTTSGEYLLNILKHYILYVTCIILYINQTSIKKKQHTHTEYHFIFFRSPLFLMRNK